MDGDLLRTVTAAFRADDWQAVKRLLEGHAEMRAMIDEPIAPFDAPAITAVRSREMLDVLLDAGADINARSRWWAGGFGLLDYADPKLAEYAISRGAIVDIHAAARLAMIDRLEELLSGDPDLIHARGGDGQTPLHFAMTVEVAAYLLDRGAEIDARDVDHVSTPAQYMTDHRHDVARFLIRRGCETDILLAAAVGDAALVQQHLEDDPEAIRTRVSDAYFPMMSGENGGTIYQWTLGWFASAHDVARKFGHEEVVNVLIERSPPLVRLFDACWSGNAAAVQELLARNPRAADAATDEDRRQLAYAAHNNNTEAVRLFLKVGLDADAPAPQHGAAPLHWAAFHGNVDMAHDLLRHEPDLEARDRDFNNTPLGWAIHGSEHGWHPEDGDYAATVQALLSAGATPPQRITGSAAVQNVLRNAATK